MVLRSTNPLDDLTGALRHEWWLGFKVGVATGMFLAVCIVAIAKLWLI